MRRTILISSVIFAALFLSLFVLIQALDSTVLNEQYLFEKLEEHGMYGALVDSMTQDMEIDGMGAQGLVDRAGEEAVKPLVHSVLSDVLSYLKDPSDDCLDIGAPEGAFNPLSVLSPRQLLSSEQLDFLSEAKNIVQLLLMARGILVLLALLLLVIIFFFAKDIASKARWAGIALLAAGILILLLAFIAHSVLLSAVDSNVAGLGASGAVVAPFLSQVLGDCIAVANFYGLVFFVVGILLVGLSLSVLARFLKKGARGEKIAEKRETHKKKIEKEIEEKMH